MTTEKKNGPNFRSKVVPEMCPLSPFCCTGRPFDPHSTPPCGKVSYQNSPQNKHMEQTPSLLLPYIIDWNVVLRRPRAWIVLKFYAFCNSHLNGPLNIIAEFIIPVTAGERLPLSRRRWKWVHRHYTFLFFPALCLLSLGQRR